MSEDQTLAGQVAVVTGGAGGLGAAAARRLARMGAAVAVCDLDEAAAQAVAKELPVDSAGFRMDVTDRASVDGAVAAAAANWGRVDILVTAAGFARDRLLVDMDDDAWNAVLQACLYGPFACSRAVAPHMIERRYGRMVHISSRAWSGNPGQANYSAAKAGVVGLTKALAKELGRYDITVNAIAPGMIRTPMTENHPKFDAIAERAIRENSIKRIGDPADVAEAIAYLVSPAASYLTGDVVHVSGGRF
jgi:3-oxoacyl-[acyl-carrier protein] reductase